MVIVGDPAPDVELDSTDGRPVRLSSTLEGGPPVLVFNRGVWCPFCAAQFRTFSALETDLWRPHGADVFGLLVEPVPALRRMRERFDRSVPLLSDPDLAVSRQYAGIEARPRRGDIAAVGLYVGDEAGVVRYAHEAEHPGDRTYANWVRLFVRDGYDRRPP